jgi:hypothetical protein
MSSLNTAVKQTATEHTLRQHSIPPNMSATDNNKAISMASPSSMDTSDVSTQLNFRQNKIIRRTTKYQIRQIIICKY